jgi:hypothetical protein
MTLPPLSCRQAENRLATLINWLALAVLVALGILAAPTPASVSVPARQHGAPACSEGAESGERAPDGELVDRLGALVGDDTLEVQHVADGRELGGNARAA